MASTAGNVDRQTTTPFLLKLFYKEGSFTPLSDFHSSLPPHIDLYAWQTCTLRELAHLLADSHPSLLPSPAIGTRLAFRLIFPDTRSSAGNISTAGGGLNSSSYPAAARFLHQDLGSVVLGRDGPGGVGVGAIAPADEEDAKIGAGVASIGAGRMGAPAGGVGADADGVMLRDVRFVIGDYIAVAILPPLGNGNVAPAQTTLRQGVGGMGMMGRGGRPVEVMRDRQQPFGNGAGKMGGGSVRENGFGGGFRGGRGRSGGGWGAGPGMGGPRGVALPSGEWRRGERLPDGPPGTGGRGTFGGGRGRDKW